MFDMLLWLGFGVQFVSMVKFHFHNALSFVLVNGVLCGVIFVCFKTFTVLQCTHKLFIK
jgi:hypothetical protein